MQIGLKPLTIIFPINYIIVIPIPFPVLTTIGIRKPFQCGLRGSLSIEIKTYFTY